MAKTWHSSLKTSFRNLVGRQETAAIEKYLETGVRVAFLEFLGKKDPTEEMEGMQENRVRGPHRGGLSTSYHGNIPYPLIPVSNITSFPTPYPLKSVPNMPNPIKFCFFSKRPILHYINIYIYLSQKTQAGPGVMSCFVCAAAHH